MGLGPLKGVIRAMLRQFNLDIYRLDSAKAVSLSRSGVEGLLRQAQSMGFMPATVVDVGAAYGSFTSQCFPVFPKARFLLLEPLTEYQPSLKELTKAMPTAQCIVAAASAHQGEIVLNVHPDLVGSSLFREVEQDTTVNGIPRTVRAITIDGLLKETVAKGPFLLKVDVQGAELEVLRGAERMLADTEYILLEVSLFRFFQDGPDFNDVILYMKSRGFVAYDISGLQYRPLDNALSQVDVAFVKEEGLFRQWHFYATSEQREAQNRRVRIHLEELLARTR
ncbi:MAG: FkbM family methyltransferase [Nitrospiraceae bacterium]|nr:FkbM family methyltransferase [Nitrospiraceae bacterium]